MSWATRPGATAPPEPPDARAVMEASALHMKGLAEARARGLGAAPLGPGEQGDPERLAAADAPDRPPGRADA